MLLHNVSKVAAPGVDALQMYQKFVKNLMVEIDEMLPKCISNLY